MTSPFEHWLNQAAEGLPAETAAAVQEEIRAHYEDSVRDHLLRGLAPDAARAAALAELGDFEETSSGFKQTHLREGRYLKAALVGMVYAAGYLLSIPLHQLLGGDVQAFNPANFLFVLYIIHSYRILFADRFCTRRVDFYATLIVRGILVVCITRMIGWTIFHHPTITESASLNLWGMASLAERALNMISLSGLLLVSSGLIVLGEQALHLHDLNLRPLLTPLCLVVAACGIALSVFGVASTYGVSHIGLWGVQLSALTGFAACILWICLFFRAGYRKMAFAR